ncbi:hypothetical protein AcW2_006190 [Taiwanofungus camphoratus]|nr:hypothetical protein AcW2_006190 [Antrodia cinnamomea]
MSHLLSNHVHRPYLFELPRTTQPLTPPDTDNEFLGQPHPSAPMQSINGVDSEPTMITGVATEVTAPVYRRGPSVAYINSTDPREARERVVQRGLRWLVVVIPPASFAREHGPLGRTLSSGSPDRLSQGILMPLFTTMGSQLSAIAREFSLPSTAGLCLYLHTNHNGIALYPRISDETWHLLWGSLFDARSSVFQTQLPISGQIEFDVDLSKARWYDAWLASARREVVDVPISVTPSRRQSISHWRGDSRTTFLDDRGDDHLDHTLLLQQSRTALNAPRLAPKKLSLLDRFETSSIASDSRVVPRHLSSQSPTEEVQLLRAALSPIVQEEELRTARKDIDTLVTSWRASASYTHSPLAATGQTSLDPANMPNVIGDLPSASTAQEFELNLDDYAWSVSSAGPPDYEHDEDVQSVVWRLPSPDLARRVLEDAPPTPATATSWGAPLSYPSSPLDGHSYYAPSVDIAGRQMSSRPVTPSTATSWGPPLSYLASPGHDDHLHRVSSPDLGARGMLSVPLTPETATSWGPPSPYPESLAHSEVVHRVPSPDVAARGMMSVPLTPSTEIFGGGPSYPLSPARSEYAPRVSSPDLGDCRLLSVPVTPLPTVLRDPPRRHTAEAISGAGDASAEAQPWRHIWPYFRETMQGEAQSLQETSPSRLVFPHYSASPAAKVGLHEAIDSFKITSSHSPQAEPWTHVWPYTRSQPWNHVWPYQDRPDEAQPWGHLWPYKTFSEGARSSEKALPFKFPSHSPSTSPAPEVRYRDLVDSSEPASQVIDQVAPWRQVWPYSQPGIVHAAVTSSPVHSHTCYPHFILYPAVYPFFELYPPLGHMMGDVQAEEFLAHYDRSYPSLNLYPAVYPHFELYPSISSVTSPITSEKNSKTAIMRVRLTASYSVFDLYPAVYPWNMEQIYHSTHLIENTKRPTSPKIRLSVHYPSFVLYQPVYPHNLEHIYLVASVDDRPTSSVLRAKHSNVVHLNPVNVALCFTYPMFDLYPATYPYSLQKIYHSRMTASAVESIETASYPRFNSSVHSPIQSDINSNTEGSRLSSTVHYPMFDLYPAVYPHSLNQIYPTQLESIILDRKTDGTMPIDKCSPLEPGTVRCPHSPEIYSPQPRRQHIVHRTRSSFSNIMNPEELPVTLNVHYPLFRLYPAVYPDNLDDIFPSANTFPPILGGALSTGICSVKPAASYPALNLYPAVYPNNVVDIYSPIVLRNEVPQPFRALSRSSTSETGRQSLERRVETMPSVILPTHYPHIDPYPGVYPFFLLYPEYVDELLPGTCEKHAITVRLEVTYPVFDIYPSVYPFLEVYPSPLREPMQLVASKVVDHSDHEPIVRRRRPKFNHLDLHRQVFGARLSSLEVMPKPPTSLIPRLEHVLATPRSRPRSGTVNMRPILPTKPMDRVTAGQPARSPVTSATSGSYIISHNPSPAAARTSSRAVGLPSSPAATRSMSATVSRPMSSILPTLPTVVEPSHLSETIDPISSTLSSSTQNSREGNKSLERIHPGGSSSATLPPKGPLLDTKVTELSRSKTLPSAKPTAPINRASAVLERARAYDHSNVTNDDVAVRLTMSALAQFPSPPRPPLPSTPNSRTVSKLDRSKYPFA